MNDKRITSEFLIEPGEVRRLVVRFKDESVYGGLFWVAEDEKVQIVEVRFEGRPLDFRVSKEGLDIEDACRTSRLMKGGEEIHIFVKNVGKEAARFEGAMR